MRSTKNFGRMKGAVLVATLSIVVPAAGQVYKIGELNTEKIQAFDRTRTVVIIPGGILEQHGPYLPSFADGFHNERLAAALAEAVVARPGWSVLMFPTVPLGTGGANEIGRKYVFPGTYAVRSSTLRAVFMDLATELGEQGFRWVFIVHGHGAPNHNRMLDQAGDYFHDTYGGRMVHLLGLLPVIAAAGEALDILTREEDRFAVHAGAGETSDMLYLRPELVQPAFRQAKPQAGEDLAALVRLARNTSWPGYFGSPRLATTAQGARRVRAATDAAVAFALKILDGIDPGSIPRLGDVARESPENVAIDDDAMRQERSTLRKQEEWLDRRKLR